MKIIIIGTPRSGTTTLCSGIGKTLNLDIICEPFNVCMRGVENPPIYVNDKIILPENCILKTLGSYRPEEKEDIDILEFFKEFIPMFDRLILLSRKDIKALVESFAYAKETNKWHEKWSKEKEFDFNFYYQSLKNDYELIPKLSEIYNTKMTWYEDLYSGDYGKIKNIMNDWNIPNLDYDSLYKFINPNNRYRQPDKLKNKLI